MRSSFEDDEVDGFTNSPTFGGGGEHSSQTPGFPVSPQTPYFNLCRSTLPADRGRSQPLNTLLTLITLVCKNDFISEKTS